MSWKTINEIFGLAAIDPEFCHALLHRPSQAIEQQGFHLTAREKQVLDTIQAQDLSDFSQQVLDSLHTDNL